MKIWLISAFEPTPVDNTRPMRFMGIANAAIQRGHEIKFFSTTFQHGSKSQRFNSNSYHEIIKGKYEVIFVHSKPYKKNISWGRMMAHYDLANKWLAEIKKQTTKPDIIYISLPPLSTVDKVTKWAKENGIPVIVDIIDPWPDVFLKVFPSSLQSFAKIPLTPLYRKLDYILKNCTAITSISKQYINWAKTFGTNGKATAYFYPAVQFQEIKKAFTQLETSVKRDEEKIRIIYAGSLSSSYDIPTILNAAEILEKRYPGKTEFSIAGTGPQEALIKEKDLNNVRFLGWLGQDEIYKNFYLSDIGLTQHVKGATQSVTYKLFDYLSAGLPILNSLESEMADIIEKNKVGFNNKTGDADSLVSNIEKFIHDKDLLSKYKKNALKLTAELGDSEIVYNKLIDFVEKFKKTA